MKTNVLILALFLFSFCLNCASHSQNLIVDDLPQTVTIHHHIGAVNGSQRFIVLEIPTEVLKYHLNHGDYLDDPTDCEPPFC